MVNDFGGETAHGRMASRHEAWVGEEADDLGAFAARLEHDAGARGPRPMERAAGALGALTSAALVMGLGFWTYDLAMRDLSAVPVVRALEGPARVAPDEPGGEVAEHQGLAVNAIQADHEEAAPERLVLAPRAQPLAEADMGPAPQQVALERETFTPAAAFAARAPLPGAQVMLASADAGALGGEAARVWGGAEIDAQPAAADPIEAALAEALGVPAPEGGIEVEPVAARAGEDAPARSPRPAGRPQAVAAPAAEIVPSALPVGTQLVQIGAFAEADEARAEWAALTGRFAPYLAGKAPVVQPVTSDGRQFYRLRAAGFADGADARRLCAALGAEGVDCVPVLVH